MAKTSIITCDSPKKNPTKAAKKATKKPTKAAKKATKKPTKAAKKATKKPTKAAKKPTRTSINRNVSRAFRDAFESHPDRTTDPGAAFAYAIEEAHALVPKGVNGFYDYEHLTFTVESMPTRANPSKLPKPSLKFRVRKATRKAGEATVDVTKRAAKKTGKVTKKAAERGAVATKEAAVYTGRQIARGGRRTAKKTSGVAKEMWQGAKKGWRENPVRRYSLSELQSMPLISSSHMEDLVFDDGKSRVWLSRMTRDDGAPYDNMVTVEALKGGNWVTVDKYKPTGSGAKKGWRENPTRGYVYRIAYETYDEEDLSAGDTDKRGWEVEISDTFTSLNDLLNEVEGSASWVEWSSSHPDGLRDWIISEDDIDYRTGDRTQRHLFIERLDKKPLTKQQIDQVGKKLRLIGQYRNNPSQDQIHITTKNNKWYVLLAQGWVLISAERAKKELAEGAVKVPWSHKQMKHHDAPERISSEELGLMLQNWHHGQGDPIYAVGSSLYAGKSVSVDILEDALNRISSIKSSARSKHDKKGHKELVEIEKQLAYLVGTKKAIDASTFLNVPKSNPAKKWTYEGYWNVVLGPNRSAEDVVREFKLDPSDKSGLDEWLEVAAAEAWVMGGLGGSIPQEWSRYHAKAIRELRSVKRYNPVDKKDSFYAWTNAPAAYDYWYIEDTGVKKGNFRKLLVTDRKRWESFQVPRYQSGWNVAFLDSDKESKSRFLDVKKNPTRDAKASVVEIVLRAPGKSIESFSNNPWVNVNKKLSTWARSKVSGVEFTILYSDGETYTGKYNFRSGKQSLCSHIQETLNAVLKAPSSKISSSEKTKWRGFKNKYDIGCSGSTPKKKAVITQVASEKTNWYWIITADDGEQYHLRGVGAPSKGNVGDRGVLTYTSSSASGGWFWSQ